MSVDVLIASCWTEKFNWTTNLIWWGSCPPCILRSGWSAAICSFVKSFFLQLIKDDYMAHIIGHCNNATKDLSRCRLCISDDATPWPSVSYNSKSTLKHMVIGSPSFPLLQRCWWGIPNDCQHWKCWWQSNDREAIRPDCCLDNRPARNREYNKLLMRKRQFYVDQAFICFQSTTQFCLWTHNL